MANDLVQYGNAVFDTVCECGKAAVPDEQISVNQFMRDSIADRKITAGGTCKTCGPVRLPFLGFENEHSN